MRRIYVNQSVKIRIRLFANKANVGYRIALQCEILALLRYNALYFHWRTYISDARKRYRGTFLCHM